MSHVQDVLWPVASAPEAAAAQLAPGDCLDTIVLRLPEVTFRLCPASSGLLHGHATHDKGTADQPNSGAAIVVKPERGAMTVAEVLRAVAALAACARLLQSADGRAVALNGLCKASAGARPPVIYDVTLLF